MRATIICYIPLLEPLKIIKNKTKHSSLSKHSFQSKNNKDTDCVGSLQNCYVQMCNIYVERSGLIISDRKINTRVVHNPDI